jgi:hypothetical protein
VSAQSRALCERQADEVPTVLLSQRPKRLLAQLADPVFIRCNDMVERVLAPATMLVSSVVVNNGLDGWIE